MNILNPETLRPGLLLHVRSKGFWGIAIRKVLGSWGNHDSIAVMRQDGSPAIGDVEPHRAHLTTIEKYNERIIKGEYTVKVLEAIGATVGDERLAAIWWMENIKGRSYDYWAFPRLLLKAIFGDWIPAAAGFEWAEWCTEGNYHAYLEGAGIDLYGKKSPTPMTTEKRTGITFANVTNKHIMAAGE